MPVAAVVFPHPLCVPAITIFGTDDFCISTEEYYLYMDIN